MLVFGNAAFLYLWMLATGRTVLRLRTSQEVCEKTSFTLLRTTGIFFLISAIMMGVGENGMRSVAMGNTNYHSVAFSIGASFTFILGFFNLVLASITNKTNLSLTFVVLLANSLAFFYGTLWITHEARLFQRFRWYDPIRIYSNENDFPNRWVEAHGAENAIPFGSMSTFDFLRTAPVHATIFLSGCVTLALLYAVLKVAMTEDPSTGKIAKKLSKKNYTTAVIGLAITLVSILAIKCLCDVNSLLYLRRTYEISLAAVVLTPLGILGMATLNGRAPSWCRALLMAAAAATFVASYSLPNDATYFEDQVGKAFESVLNSNCTGGSNDNNRDYNYPPPPYLKESTTTPETIQTSSDQACFQLKDGYKKIGITCIDKDKICDGIVDIVEPAEICGAAPNYYVYTASKGAHFVDEIFCPSNGIDDVVSTMRAVNWLSMLLSLAMVVALAFTFGDYDSDGDYDEGSTEEKERTAFLHVWDKIHGSLFSKVSDVKVQEDVPIIKKKLESPC